MQLNGLDFLFWAAGFVGNVTLFGVLLWRRRHGRYPIFTILIGMNVIRTVVLSCILKFGSKSQYYYTYWSLTMADAVLQFSVVYEMATHIFRPLGTWARDVRGSLVGLICLTMVVAGGLTWLASPPSQMWMQAVVIKGNFFSEVCMGELFVGILAVSVDVGLPWKTHAAKISQGLGAYSIMEVLIEGGHNYFGIGQDDRLYQMLAHVRMLGYLGCLCYWIFSLWPDEPASRPLTNEMHLRLSELQRVVEEDLRRLRSRRQP